MSALLEVEDLHVRIDARARTVHAVRGVSFSVGRGEVLSIVGESGCGKSLTTMAVMGLLPHGGARTAARLEMAGNDLSVLSDRQMSDIRGNRMAIVLQDPMTSLNPSYTIGNQLEEVYLRHKGGPRAKARERAISLLERVGIAAASSRLPQFPHQLSGGLRQRVMIAMALMCEPELIIADEATTALDVTVQAQILELLQELRTEFQLGILLITHDMGVVARMADRVAVMYAGEIVETGTVAAVFGNPAHPYTRGLLDAIPSGHLGSRLTAIPGVVPSLDATIVGCTFRNRCARAQDSCAVGPIPLTTPARDRAWRCLFPLDRADGYANGDAPRSASRR